MNMLSVSISWYLLELLRWLFSDSICGVINGSNFSQSSFRRSPSSNLDEKPLPETKQQRLIAPMKNVSNSWENHPYTFSPQYIKFLGIIQLLATFASFYEIPFTFIPLFELFERYYFREIFSFRGKIPLLISIFSMFLVQLGFSRFHFADNAKLMRISRSIQKVFIWWKFNSFFGSWKHWWLFNANSYDERYSHDFNYCDNLNAEVNFKHE